mmetsp:Transcript_47302/g.101280  ORF Transcript_47302/g.101280 Transcript_47302/m.101280 type:complete len:101 (+) Transcript_47302:527-829(+)
MVSKIGVRSCQEYRRRRFNCPSRSKMFVLHDRGELKTLVVNVTQKKKNADRSGELARSALCLGRVACNLVLLLLLVLVLLVASSSGLSLRLSARFSWFRV